MNVIRPVGFLVGWVYTVGGVHCGCFLSHAIDPRAYCARPAVRSDGFSPMRGGPP